MSLIKQCPRCGEKRPLTETVCQGLFRDRQCRWNLFEVLPTPEHGEAIEPPPEAAGTETATPIGGEAHCRNGHPLAPGDSLCLLCGELAAPAAPPEESGEADAGGGPAPRGVNGWRLGAPLAVVSGEADLFLATREEGTADPPEWTGVFKHYRRGIEPESALYPALRILNPDHGLRLLDDGRFEARAYEVWEHLPLGTLGAIPAEERADPDFVRQTVREIGGALQGLAEVQIVHRDLKPANVLVRTRQPLDLVLADFSTAAVSEFDLQLTVSRQTTRYAAPETIVGTCSAASDWWSLGVMVLEMLTRGRGFEGVHERAFLLHLITRGLAVPEDLPEEWRELLMGLLTRDPAQRWGWGQVQRWLEGERGIPHGYRDEETDTGGLGRSLRLAARSWSTPESFALAAADADGWNEARDILFSGRLATWLQERGGDRDPERASRVRALAADTDVPEDARLAGALLVLNENLPLCWQGEIVTPPWVLSHPEVAWAWLDSPLPGYLRRLDREHWFVRLRERADRVRARIRETRIECDEAQLSAALLATSQNMLENRWRQRRRLFPEADLAALAAIVERRTPSEEDLILLVSARSDQFRPAAALLEEAENEAHRARVLFSREEAEQWLELSRRQILDLLNDRLAHFVRCGRETADQWADDFRQNRRISLARALVLLSMDEGEWQEPPRQDYVRNVMDFFRRRMLNGLQRGGLVRMTIGRTSAKLDLTELGGPARPAEALLGGVIARRGQAVALDPAPLLADPERERRLRRLHQNAIDYARDTGIHALFLGYPFVVMRDARAGEDARPRIAPVLLWPVRLEMTAGARGAVRLAFDEDRAEVRINPALEGLLGAAAGNWHEILEDLREREHLNPQLVMDALAPVATALHPAPSDAAQVVPLPPAGVRATAGEIQLHGAAVLFLCDFSGQTIAEDLKALAVRPIQGTALEAAIQSGVVKVDDGPVMPPPEMDRYFATEADPSQQDAVFRARQAPGLVVQGPPGTGKSQTIVNIVCDAIGRGERVLVVCQKLAALNVVRKRLESEGMAERLFVLNDPVSDRKAALLALREQLQEPVRTPPQEERLQRERKGCARQIENLEEELNSAHAALNEPPPDQPAHLSYREVLEKLITVEAGPRRPVECPSLWEIFRSLDLAATEELIAEIAPLASLWLEAQFEYSPLKCLGQFRTDGASLNEFSDALTALRAAEEQRLEVLGRHPRLYELDAAAPLEEWLNEHEVALRTLPDEVAASLSRWAVPLKSPAPGQPSALEELLQWLEQMEARLRALDGWTLNPALYEQIALRGTRPLRELAEEAGRLAVPPRSLFARLNPARWLARRRLDAWIRQAGADPGATDPATLHAAAGLELDTRDERAKLKQWRESLGDPAGPAVEPLPALKAIVHRLLEQLRPVVSAAGRVQTCPVPGTVEALCGGDSAASVGAAFDVCHASLALWAATRESEARLEEAAQWFAPDWVEAKRFALKQRTRGADFLELIQEAIPSIPAFQEFRLRARRLTAQALRVLALLRGQESGWRKIPAAELPLEVERTVLREALLVWKTAAEQMCPTLLMSRDERGQKVRRLQKADREMRKVTRHLLARCSPYVTIAGRSQWDDVVMLTGPRARRLREVVERGDPLGLFHLRPIWMMNPEMASRLFALQPGMFDLLVFDEASQLPVECALPALFRARRFVVSGDEKQMPPSRFFSSQLDSDEEVTTEDLLDAEDAGVSDEERERLRQAVGRRELKDCPDLLTLAQNLLPTATLQIHYRSKYRELINFSNAAFYAGRLSIPSRHPEARIREFRPLEVDRVDGRYSGQTNPAEADRVVERLRELWRQMPGERPSIGVVTFNLKQAELIQDRLEGMAESDEEFRRAWEEEQQRNQAGEDMSFFVKNLENVQGDERDFILFSTTFGRDGNGVFRRNFGVLGQQGGERRLNVAVTRARHKVVVVTSLPLNEISGWSTSHMRRLPVIPRDFLQGWLAYAERLNAGEFDAGRDLLHSLNGRGGRGHGHRDGYVPESPFREQVAAFLRELGHDPQTTDGDALGVDFALVDPRTGLYGLGVECEAPHHRALASARARELWRPAVLKASMPMLHRVGLHAWYQAKAEEQQRLQQAVQEALEQ